MTTLVQKFDIFSPAAGAFREVELHQPLTQIHIDTIARSWDPLLNRQASVALAKRKLSGSSDRDSWNSILQSLECPDATWDWGSIADPSKMGAAYTSFCVYADGEVQAAMVLNLTMRCRYSSQVNEHMVYIDYLAIAPWNRRAIKSPIEFQGLGTVMLGIAVQLSKQEGWKGRIGLHSLPQSEGFYAKHRMELIGIDTKKEDLMYCEFTENGADRFLS